MEPKGGQKVLYNKRVCYTVPWLVACVSFLRSLESFGVLFCDLLQAHDCVKVAGKFYQPLWTCMLCPFGCHLGSLGPFGSNVGAVVELFWVFLLIIYSAYSGPDRDINGDCFDL